MNFGPCRIIFVNFNLSLILSALTMSFSILTQDVSLILTLIGVSMSVCFHLSLAVSGYASRRQQALDSSNITRPRRRSSDPTRPTNDRAPLVATSIGSSSSAAPLRRNFFRSPLLYQNAFLYVFSRLFCTTALVYIPVSVLCAIHLVDDFIYFIGQFICLQCRIVAETQRIRTNQMKI